MISDAIVVPLKSFALAKGRLRVGGTTDVNAIVRDLASGVITSAAPRHVIVLCESDDVATFAADAGAEVIQSAAQGLNGAVQLAYAAIGARYERLIVVHGDLRSPTGLGEFDPDEGVTVVADHLGRGTNVLVVPTGFDFRFGYGSDSATFHAAEARRLGLDLHVIYDSPWRFDVDEPGDLESPEQHQRGPEGPL